MKIISAEFIKSGTQPLHYPEGDLPEIAFIGRSNVGKSSMINRLVNQKHLVKTSSTPGCTRLINFFDINGRFRFVDLPGYGFARISISEKKAWRIMIETYLSGRPGLRCAVMIIDIRRDPDEKDRVMKDWLNRYGIPIIPVLTKADKLSSNNRHRQMNRIADALGFIRENIVVFSAKTTLGVDAAWAAISARLDPSGTTSPGMCADLAEEEKK
ncbi:MAG TPA: ribosome biogenesis GTP-binding protein YihA/YsxC [Desulfatirhabdiaceae bacterium]|nr:ribosome biogenesis GTP-binding protein YihA/YsxC [Desulfatirhabdiaceae bacterium]